MFFISFLSLEVKKLMNPAVYKFNGFHYKTISRNYELPTTKRYRVLVVASTDPN